MLLHCDKQMMITLLIAVTFIVHTEGQGFAECPEGARTVVEDTEGVVLTCSGYNGTVKWRYTKPSSAATGFGECAASCTLTPGFDYFFELNAIDSTSSILTLKKQATGTSFGSAIYTIEPCICNITIAAKTTTTTTTTKTTTTTTTTPPAESEGVRVGKAVWVSVVTSLSLPVAVVIHLIDF